MVVIIAGTNRKLLRVKEGEAGLEGIATRDRAVKQMIALNHSQNRLGNSCFVKSITNT